MKIIEQFSQGKSTTTPSEDAVVVTAYYAAVIDGATAKTDFRYEGGETPGHLAARLLADAIPALPTEASAAEVITLLTQKLALPTVAPAHRPTASIAIFSKHHREVWMVGDCQAGLVHADRRVETITNPKRIDSVLASWRRSILLSYLNRGLLSQSEILNQDPGRRIIQPFITAQPHGHNRDFGVLDGTPVPERFIKRINIPSDVTTLILASDGYPSLQSTLQASEQRLHQLLALDPLCIGPLMGTKGVKPGARSFDDRTYLKIEI